MYPPNGSRSDRGRGRRAKGCVGVQAKRPGRNVMDTNGHKNKREGLTLARKSLSYLQARQESNLQPPVLETGALPIELRT